MSLPERLPVLINHVSRFGYPCHAARGDRRRRRLGGGRRLNPGLADAACFATVDPEGLLIGELDGAPAATISCVDYDARFAFLGFYIVRPDLRGRGYGLRIWNAAVTHAPARTVGLDGVVAQQENYRKSGFRFAYANIRYGGTVAPAPDALAGIVPLADVPFATFCAPISVICLILVVPDVDTTVLPLRSSTVFRFADFFDTNRFAVTKWVMVNETCFCRSRLLVVEPHSRSMVPFAIGGIWVAEVPG